MKPIKIMQIFCVCSLIFINTQAVALVRNTMQKRAADIEHKIAGANHRIAHLMDMKHKEQEFDEAIFKGELVENFAVDDTNPDLTVKRVSRKQES